MATQLFPPLPLDEWRPTRDTIQAYAHLLGKIRRALTPPQKHWWHVSLRVTTTGLTTTPIPAGDKTFALLLDFVNHRLLATTSYGGRREFPLRGQSVKQFKDELLRDLQAWGIEPAIDAAPFDDDTPGAYDKTAVANFWQALTQIDVALKALRHGFRGESSPVQLWPHHFDLAVVWFSGRLVPDQDPNDPDYADEQMNFGFSTGDAGMPEPYFYATAYPTPDGFTDHALPEGAHWHTEGWTGALLPYRLLTETADPHAKLFAFFKTAHEAGAQHMV